LPGEKSKIFTRLNRLEMSKLQGFALGKANFAQLVTNQRLFERPLSIASGANRILARLSGNALAR